MVRDSPSLCIVQKYFILLFYIMKNHHHVNVFRFDFIIVGAGMAGPIIARRLSDNPWRKILLIEAGPEEPSMTAIPGFAFNAINTTLDWNFKTEPTLSHPTACLGIKYQLS